MSAFTQVLPRGLNITIALSLSTIFALARDQRNVPQRSQGHWGRRYIYVVPLWVDTLAGSTRPATG